MPRKAETATILVVDDSESTRYVLSRALRQAGYKVITASDGEEALELVRQKPDLVTLDVHLPGINGLEVCKRIKSDPETRSIPVVHISATFVDDRDKANALDSGADGYLTHPLEDIVVVATVGAYLRARDAERQREELLARSELDVEELRQERELRERFVAMLTHDLRTPLTAAKMSAQMIVRQGGLPDSTLKLASRIRDSIDRADRMIMDLLDANRIRAGEKVQVEFKDCSLKEVIESTLEEMTTVHGNRFVFRAKAEPVGKWDCAQLSRAIENLTGNAIKYGALDEPITLGLDEDPEFVRITIHNVGNPISLSEQGKLFAPYARAASAEKSAKRGWGLGLTLVRGVAEAHGGSVSVTSSPEDGTTFTMKIAKNIASGLTVASVSHAPQKQSAT